MPEVIVVGAGISGLRCAELLASAGVDVLVLEKKKTFGGTFGENLEAFPQYHYSKLEISVPASAVDNVKIYCGEGSYKQRLVLQFQRPILRLVKRGPASDSIDSFLFQRARSVGAKILFNQNVESLRKTSDDRILIQTAQESHECKILVAADGVFSSVRKCLGMSGLQKTEGVGYIAKVEGAKLGRCETVGIFNYKRWPGSYCYLIGYPEGSYATVGMTLRPAYSSGSVQKYFDSLIDYLPEILGAARIVDYTRGFVTLGSRDRELAACLNSSKRTNVLFIGEAGGFQDPTLAFGLAPALLSARLAASLIIRALDEENFTILDEYQLAARQTLVRDESKRISFRYVLETMSEAELTSFLTTLSKYPEIAERVMVSGEYIRNFLPLVLRSASRNPWMVSFPFRFVKTSRSLKSRRPKNSN